jgi:actin-like ATPase involved in cell morphogenesis
VLVLRVLCVRAKVTPAAARLAGGGEDAPLVRPIRRGVVEDWDALESIYHHIFYDQVRHTWWKRVRRLRRAVRTRLERRAAAAPRSSGG